MGFDWETILDAEDNMQDAYDDLLDWTDRVVFGCDYGPTDEEIDRMIEEDLRREYEEDCGDSDWDSDELDWDSGEDNEG